MMNSRYAVLRRKWKTLRFTDYMSTSAVHHKDGLLLGVYTQEKNDECDIGTSFFKELDTQWKNKLSSVLKHAGKIKCGSAKVFYDVVHEYPIISVVGLGSKAAAINGLECIDEKSDNIRLATAAGIKSFVDMGIDKVVVDITERPNAAAEGAYLAAWNYKESERKKLPQDIEPAQKDPAWDEGKVYAECQNFARHLMESPSNLMTPSLFADTVLHAFEKENCTVEIFEQDWIEKQNMQAFLSVAKGSAEEPRFMKITYKSPSANALNPLILVGKGVTFDSGGISIKPSQAMDEMRADMGGAATVASAVLAAAKLNLNVHVIGLIPLCENMPSSTSCKPGDVVVARNGSSIQIDNTDAEGRLLLADALNYAQDLNPSAVIDVATLTGGIIVALGGAASGVFSNDDVLWKQLQKAAMCTGDRVWRMPLFKFYSKQVKPAQLADINNVGSGGRAGAACTAAAFLHHFIKSDTKWMHLDIASTMKSNEKDCPYLGKGMSGRPTRTLVKFMYNYTQS
uniref:Cytosol aminopeptidase n=1 Tax=Phallusia mammillata TaxID=59560 RepID=A0A6F9DJK3_9ASCI|nr:cytosol aminopeptidase [Phallusia mammillata]